MDQLSADSRASRPRYRRILVNDDRRRVGHFGAPFRNLFSPRRLPVSSPPRLAAHPPPVPHRGRFIKDWVEKKVRRQLAHAQKRKGFGWERWSRQWLYDTLGLFNSYRVRRDRPKVAPAG